MKTSLMLTGLAALLCAPAYADNAGVNTLLSSHPEVSEFYQAAVASGVLTGLAPDATYTVFAPLNDDFTKLSIDSACLQSPDCNAQAAAILRNHFIPGKVSIADATAQKGGLFSINERFVNIGEQGRGRYIVDGEPIGRATRAGGSIMYRISGVIANPRELSMLDALEAGAPPQVAVSTSTTQHVIPDPSCPPPGCPDSATHTIERTETYITPAQ